MADRVRDDHDRWDRLFFDALRGITRYGTALGIAIGATFPAAASDPGLTAAVRLAQLESEIDPRPMWWSAIYRDTFGDIDKWLPLAPGMLKAMRGNSSILIDLYTTGNRSTLYTIRTFATAHPSYVAGRPLNVILTTSAGIYISGVATGSSWVAGDVITIVNAATITNKGGLGGDGGASASTPPGLPGQNGTNGADAINLAWPVTIDNTNGYIFGSSGGSGGGGGACSANLIYQAGGGGGGGGRGYPDAAGGDGGASVGQPGTAAQDGDTTGGALEGSGGNDNGVAIGGDGGGYTNSTPQLWAAVGEHGIVGNLGAARGTRGVAGKAVDLNGFAITWLGGNNASQVKGAQT
jgi:hypothetical protein